MTDGTRSPDNAGRSVVPPIPQWLADRPTVGGLVVPWITPRTTDGRYLLGTIEESLVAAAFQDRLCGVCGKPLADRLVLLMRLADLRLRTSHEPALHPQCAAYTIAACPMVNGRMRRYRTTPHRLDDLMAPGRDANERLGKPAEPWFAVWLGEYRVVDARGFLAATYSDGEPLRIRPITWRWMTGIL